MIGLLGLGVPLIFSVLAVVAIYGGIKVYIGRKKLKLAKELPEGICANCGAKITGGLCPNCDMSK
jgi:hypothetical protein